VAREGAGEAARRDMQRRTILLVGRIFAIFLAAFLLVWLVMRPVIARRHRGRQGETFLEEQVRKHPADTYALRQLAIACEGAGYWDRAISCAEKATTLEPEDPRAWVTYGLCAQAIYRKTHDPARHEEARGWLEGAGGRLLALCRRIGSCDGERFEYIELCRMATTFLIEAAKPKQARQAYALAVEAAQEWAESEDADEREWAEAYLRELTDQDPWGLAASLEDMQ